MTIDRTIRHPGLALLLGFTLLNALLCMLPSARTFAESNLENSPFVASELVTVDIMVLYNIAADSLYANNALTRINHLVGVSNQIYRNSGIKLSLRVVHTLKIDYEADYDSSTALNHLSEQSHPAFLNVPALREEYGADLVVLMRPYANDGYCGIAWLGGNGSNGDFSHPQEKNYAMSHLSIDCSSFNLSHELGHNMGLNHSRKQNSDGATFDFALGYGVENDFVTVMAYTSVFNANKINLYSNLNLTCGASPCGINRNSSNGADAVYTLTHVGPQIANYYTKKVPVLGRLNNGHLDADGNGTSDLVLHHINGNWRLYTMNGQALLEKLTIPLMGDPAWQSRGRDDYNGDGISDNLLRNKNTGEWQIYLMEKNKIIAQSQLPMTENLDWSVVANGDFNGDGMGDVLLQHTDGRWFLYFLAGTTVKTYAKPALPESLVISTAYQSGQSGQSRQADSNMISGDFNGDGKSDVILRAENGSWHLYSMNAGDIQVDGNIAIDNSLLLEEMVSGDFNGDKKDDLLLRKKNGSWSIYNFNGFDVGAPSNVDITNDPDWEIAASGDFNGDGFSDVLLRNVLFGNWKLYTINLNRVQSNSEVLLSKDLNWRIAGT